jgi:hypothetical protein
MKSKTSKKNYQAPKIEQVKLDTEISLVMTSPIPPNPMPPIPGYNSKIFKF